MPSIDISKLADESLHEVAGVLASEDLDRDGEHFDYDSSKPLFQKWSQDLYDATKKTAAPGEESYGNVRLQHSKTCVGKLVKIIFDDVAKTIWGIAKITDDKVWDDIRRGIYSAFSVAGKLVRSIVKNGKTWITILPMEVSVVDYPANPNSTFDWACASFAKFAKPAFAPDAVSEEKDPAPPLAEEPKPQDGLPAAVTEEPDTQEGKHDSEPPVADEEAMEEEIHPGIHAEVRARLTKKSGLPETLVGAQTMSDTEKAAAEKAAEVEKAGRLALHDHFAAIKAKASAHAGEMNHTKCSKHAADVHELVDKCAKLAGTPAFDAETEHTVAEHMPADGEAKAAKAEIEKLAGEVKELKTKLEAAEKAAKIEPVVGDPKDAVKTGTEVEKAAAAKKDTEATAEIAKAAFGIDKDGKRCQADPKAMSDLFYKVTNAKQYRAAHPVK
jgi:copper chaperone CopZ